MIALEQLEDLTEDNIIQMKNEANLILCSVSKNDIYEIKSMIMPSVFTFNVIKSIMAYHNPDEDIEQINWQILKKKILCRHDIFIRKCQSISIQYFSQEYKQKVQKILKQISCYLEHKSQTLVKDEFSKKMWKWSILMRSIMYGSKYTKIED